MTYPNRISRQQAIQQYGNTGAEVRRDLALYDTFSTLGTGAGTSLTNLEWFKKGTANGKSREETNLINGGRMNDGLDLLVDQIETDIFISSTVADTGWLNERSLWVQLMSRGVLVINVNGKEKVVDGPLKLFPPKVQLIETADVALAMHSGKQDSTTAGAAATPAETKQTVLYAARHAGEVYRCEPFMLEHGQQFTARVEFDGGTLVVPTSTVLNVRLRLSATRQGWKNA